MPPWTGKGFPRGMLRLSIRALTQDRLEVWLSSQSWVVGKEQVEQGVIRECGTERGWDRGGGTEGVGLWTLTFVTEPAFPASFA